MYYLIKNVRLISKEEFNKIVEEGRAKGHTHIKFMRVGYCPRVVDFESAAFKNISSNLEGHGVYAVCTGFPFYSNCNRHAYKPYVSDVTEKPNSSYEAGLADFINS